MPAAHAKLSPSGSSRWLLCPASVNKSSHKKDKSNAIADRGTYIHQIGENLLNGKQQNVGDSIIVSDSDLPMSYIIHDMLDEAQSYRDYVQRLVKRDVDSELIVEMQVDLSDIAGDTFGHADAVIIENNTLHVVDLKTGSQLVDADNNSQLKLYGYGAYLELSLMYSIKSIVLHVVQNNLKVGGNKSSEWELDPDELLNWIEDTVKPKANNALSDNPECVAGEVQCRWCPASADCETALNYANQILDDAFEDFEHKEETTNLQKIAKFVQNFKFINNLNKSFENKLFDELVKGNEVEGFKLVNKNKRKVWANEIETFDKLKTWAKLDDIAPRKLVTPNQAEKVLGKVSTVKANKFKELWVQPEGELALAPSTDKRDGVSIANEFNNINEEL